MKELMFKRAGLIIILILFMLTEFRCDKIEESIIPSVPFSYTINLAAHNEVNVAGNSIFIEGIGYGGVIVYCEYPGSFFAFDATCTNEVNSTCLVKNQGVLGTCECCKSEFMLIGGGFPASGPAKEGLRQYQTSLINGSLRIYNE